MKRAVLIRAACMTVLAFVAATSATADDKAAKVVDAMIAAHGGMEAWAGAPTVYFEDEWELPGSPMKFGAETTVEQGRRRAYLDFRTLGASVVWDGEKAWSTNWAMPTPPRFLAQLNYFFANLVWLARDPGVILTHEGARTLWDDPVEYIAIRVTYEPGVGDTPKDYYVLFIHPDTKQLHGCEYIVTYRSILPEGMEHTPPHILIYDEYTTVAGLTVPVKYTIYELDRKFYAGMTVSNWAFDGPFDESRMTMPEGAVIDESQP